MTTLYRLIEEMKHCNEKAVEFSAKFNKRAEFLEGLSNNRAENAGILDPFKKAQRLRALKRDDHMLEDFGKAQSFFKGEVERISAYLNGLLAYKQLIGIRPTMDPHDEIHIDYGL